MSQKQVVAGEKHREGTEETAPAGKVRAGVTLGMGTAELQLLWQREWGREERLELGHSREQRAGRAQRNPGARNEKEGGQVGLQIELCGRVERSVSAGVRFTF